MPKLKHSILAAALFLLLAPPALAAANCPTSASGVDCTPKYLMGGTCVDNNTVDNTWAPQCSSPLTLNCDYNGFDPSVPKCVCGAPGYEQVGSWGCILKCADSSQVHCAPAGVCQAKDYGPAAGIQGSGTAGTCSTLGKGVADYCTGACNDNCSAGFVSYGSGCVAASTLVYDNSASTFFGKDVVNNLWKAITGVWSISGNNIFNNNSGNVGIGTNAPDASAKLDVRGSIRGDHNVNTSTSNFGKALVGYCGTFDSACFGNLNIANPSTDYGFRQSDAGFTTINSAAGKTISFKEGDSLKMQLSGGRLGIRVSNAPTIDLAIGDTDTGLQQKGDGMLAVYTNNAERVRVDSAGKVGIGTPSPGYELDVSGDVRFTGTLQGGSIPAARINSGTIDNARLDADLQDLADGSLTATKVQYGSNFITTSGSSGQVWKSDGSGAGYWGTDIDTDTNTNSSTICNGANVYLNGDGWCRTVNTNTNPWYSWSAWGEVYNGAQNDQPMSSTSNSLCFLTHVRFRDIDGGDEYAHCEIYASGGTWYLQTRTWNTDDADAYCAARCISW